MIVCLYVNIYIYENYIYTSLENYVYIYIICMYIFT